MRGFVKIAVALALLFPSVMMGQVLKPGKVVEMKGSFLRPLQPRDSVLIADQLKYGFRLEGVAEGTGLAFPDFSKGFSDSVEVVGSWQLDTIKTYKGKKDAPSTYDIEGSIVITSFDEGVYQLPQLAALRASATDGTVDTLVFDPQVLEVKTMPVDTATFQIHDLKGQVRYPITFKEVLPYILGILLLAAIVAAAVWYILRKRRLQKEEEAAEPAYIIALKKLEHFRGDKYWAPEKQKVFYSGITDALREYIVDRFGVEAMEMTTAEIFAGLKDQDIPKDIYSEMKALFERADFVKFAKSVATDEENAAALPSAVRFVTATYQAQLDSEQQNQNENIAQAEPEKPSDKKDGDSDEPDYSAYMPK